MNELAAPVPERRDLAGRRVLLGLTGGIACYQAAELTRELVKAGAEVQVVMTEAAEQFIGPVTMQALSGRPVFTSQWDTRAGNNMAHINLGRESDVVLVKASRSAGLERVAQALIAAPEVG